MTALELADALEKDCWHISAVTAQDAADTLRRLAAEVERLKKPLSDEQIVSIVREAARGSAINRDGTTSQRIARAIEAAHGITGAPHDR